MRGVDDIRLRVSFRDNLKIKRLQRTLGPEGPLCLIYLWLYAGSNHPSGDLGEMSSEDLEHCAKWTGEAGLFSRTMCEFGFIETRKGHLFLHDWAEEQPWAVNAERRVRQASLAAARRWNSANADSNAVSNAVSNAASNAPSFPTLLTHLSQQPHADSNADSITQGAKKSDGNGERVDFLLSSEEEKRPKKQKQEPTKAWLAWKTGFRTVSPFEECKPEHVEGLDALMRAYDSEKLAGAAASFKRDCDAGRIKVASLSTFLKVAKNYFPKEPEKEQEADKFRRQIEAGQGTLTTRLKAVGYSLFWPKDKKDGEFYLRWYEFLKLNKALPTGIPEPPK